MSSTITPDGEALQLRHQIESLCFALEDLSKYVNDHRTGNGMLEAVAVKFIEGRIKILISTSKSMIKPESPNSNEGSTLGNSGGASPGRRKLYHKSLQTYERRSTDDLHTNKANNFILQQGKFTSKPAPPIPPMRISLGAIQQRDNEKFTLISPNRGTTTTTTATPPPVPYKPSPPAVPSPDANNTNHPGHSSVIVGPSNSNQPGPAHSSVIVGHSNLNQPIRPARIGGGSSNSLVIARPSTLLKDKAASFVYPPPPNKIVPPPRVPSARAVMSAPNLHDSHSPSQATEAPPSAGPQVTSPAATPAQSHTSSPLSSLQSSCHFRSLAALNRLREAKSKVSPKGHEQVYDDPYQKDSPISSSVPVLNLRQSLPLITDPNPPPSNRPSKKLPNPPLKSSAPTSSLNLLGLFPPGVQPNPILNHAPAQQPNPPSNPVTPSTTPNSTPITTPTKTHTGSATTGKPTPPPRGKKIQSTVRNVTREIVETRLPPDATPAERKRWKRLCAVEELIITEAEYNNHLVFAINNFLMPCREGNIINSSELYDLFGNIEDILAVSEKLLVSFEFINLKSTNPEDQRVGKIFLEDMSHLELYSVYCINQEHSNDRFTKLKEHNAEFRNLLQTVHAMPETRSLDLSAYLIKPFQRIMKYPLLLNSIINDTDTSHPDYPDLVEALKQLEGMVGTANEQKRLYENITKMTELHVLFGEALRPYNVSLTDPDRLYITEGDFKVGIDGSKLEKMRLYLFNDILIIVAKQKIKGVVPLSKCVVWDLSDSVVNGKSVTDSFEIIQTDDKRRVVVRASGRAEKEGWMTRFNECVAQFY
eukprot:TRINITY_DN22706_c0_g1_i1.p1 TRINITY_DN22706_c0_g1~~TRINITY_DN22706_c0_g1_i1.p1  ORF type:complete len:818 (-),score=155.06 TRINITY_DN22706_c0_g1_i1:117-2570(-)